MLKRILGTMAVLALLMSPELASMNKPRPSSTMHTAVATSSSPRTTARLASWFDIKVPFVHLQLF